MARTFGPLLSLKAFAPFTPSPLCPPPKVNGSIRVELTPSYYSIDKHMS
jgi:hypothetical protein